MIKYLLVIALSSCVVMGKAQGTINDGLIAHYDLDGNANDIAPDPANGTVSMAIPTADRKGSSGKAYVFSASSHRISITPKPKFDFIGNDSVSLSAWIRADQFPALDGRILSFHTTSGGIEINLWGSSHGADTGKIEILNFDGGTMTARLILPTDSAVKKNSWHHIAVTMVTSDSLTSRIYLDGRLAAQKRSAFTFFSNMGLVIGNHAVNNWYFPGAIDDVRIYKRVITQSEIDMLAGKTFVTGLKGPKTAGEEKISVYPNPSNGVFVLEAEPGQYDKAEVLNILGEMVISTAYTKQVDLSNAAKGVYFLKLYSQSDLVCSKKIVVE